MKLTAATGAVIFWGFWTHTIALSLGCCCRPLTYTETYGRGKNPISFVGIKRIITQRKIEREAEK